MTKTFLPRTPGVMTPRKLDQMRRTLILTAWQDYKLFGYRTEAVMSLARRIAKAKAKQPANGQQVRQAEMEWE